MIDFAPVPDGCLAEDGKASQTSHCPADFRQYERGAKKDDDRRGSQSGEGSTLEK